MMQKQRCDKSETTYLQHFISLLVHQKKRLLCDLMQTPIIYEIDIFNNQLNMQKIQSMHLLNDS